jgi:hypothetical protein
VRLPLLLETIVKKFTKCKVQHGEETREVLLPEERATVGEKIVIKEPDNSGLWEVVDLVKINGAKTQES